MKHLYTHRFHYGFKLHLNYYYFIFIQGIVDQGKLSYRDNKGKYIYSQLHSISNGKWRDWRKEALSRKDSE